MGHIRTPKFELQFETNTGIESYGVNSFKEANEKIELSKRWIHPPTGKIWLWGNCKAGENTITKRSNADYLNYNRESKQWEPAFVS